MSEAEDDATLVDADADLDPYEEVGEAPPPSLAEVVAALDRRYPPQTREEWDAVGLVAGDPAEPVRKVLFAVDPVAAVVGEALEWGADLLVTHHPLLLRAVHRVAADTFKGAVVHRLIRGGVGLYVAHTNADAAPGGVADALARLLGVVELRPLVPAGAGGAAPGTGIGRVGRLPAPMTLGELARRAAQVLPATEQGVRVAGDLDAPVSTVAVLGGAGDSLFEAVRRSGADVYVTADLRHHPASEAREHAEHAGGGRPYLVDLSHWASEWPWLDGAARLLGDDLAARGARVETRVSARRTDPWTARIASPTMTQPDIWTVEGPTP